MMEARSIMLIFVVVLFHNQQTVFGQGDFLYRKGVEMKCRDGFDMFGSRQLRCSGENWSIKVPECKPRCSNPGIPGHGFLKNSSLSVFKHGDRVTFGCDDTYTLQGQQTIECRDGRWSHDIPKCLTSCVDPGQIGNGVRIGEDFNHGRFVMYRCWYHYTLEGASRMTCNDGKWDNKRPTCKAPCSDPGLLQDGKRTGNDFRHRKQVTYSCKIGTKLTGQKTMQCNDGNWTNKKPSCKVVDCGILITPSNGKKIKETNTTYLGRTVFACNKGFRLKGSSVRVCEANGQWSGITATCKAVECGDPGMPIHGSRTPNKRKYVYQDRVRFECKTNYTMAGKTDLTCQHDGQWSGYKVFCLAPCNDPGIPKDGIRFDHTFLNGQSVRFRCKSGRQMTGSPYITCYDGRWSNVIPSCHRPCQEPGSPFKGNKIGHDYRHGKTVSYTCQKGTRLMGASSSTCNDGRWSSAVPACMDNCRKPDKPLNGSMVGNDFSHGQRVSFQCHNGFRLRGNRTMVCYNGLWNSTIPTCIGFCPPLGVPINGARLDSNFDYNARVRFECNSGYDIRGPAALFCVNGKWNNRIPVCKARCQNPGYPRNGRRKGNNFGHHMSVEFFCNNGYDLVGRQSIRCEDGRWSGSTPTCEVGCQDPGIPKWMKRQGDSFKSRSSLIYSCIAPYVISGNSILTCNNGRWSHSLPTCTDCGSALGMENKKISDGNIRASSVRDRNHQAKDGRLNGLRAWCSGSENSPYIEIDFGKPYQLTSLATQGSAVDNRWVGSFSVKTNLAGSRFTSYREHDTEKMFQGNTNGSSVVRNRFSERIIARRIRIYPMKLGGFFRQPACMRVEIYGCDLPLDCVMIKSRIVAKWNSNYYGGFVYYKAYLTDTTNRSWKLELENESHGNPNSKRFLKYEDLPFVLDVPPKHEELQVGTKVLAPWGGRYYTGTIVTARDSNNRYQVRADDNDRDMFTIDQIRLLKAPTFCN